MYPDWTRLMDFAEKMEKSRAAGRTQSTGPVLCQEGAWDGCLDPHQPPIGWSGVTITKRVVNTTGSKNGPCIPSIKEFID